MIIGRNVILKSICPNIFGLSTVKLAVALTLIGGVRRTNKSGMQIRGESHLLLVGEPGIHNTPTYMYLYSFNAITSNR